MQNKFLLYIDILGFSDLVSEDGYRVNDLYEVIASLHVHNHDAFKVVIFSDTILVYNVNGGDNPKDNSYLIMFLCEFVRDLMHRLTGKGIYFRALITRGNFTHYTLNGMPCFWGEALIEAYNSEKEIKAVGLFINKKIVKDCDVFKYRVFNKNYDFVYVTQALDDLELYGDGGYPIESFLIEETDLKWHMMPEIDHVSNMYLGSINKNYPSSVKEKYRSSWKYYQKHYPHITKHLIENKHDLRTFSPKVNWEEVIERYPEDYSWAVKETVEF